MSDKPIKKPKKAKRYRDAGSGEYVSREYADKNPNSTIGESTK